MSIRHEKECDANPGHGCVWLTDDGEDEDGNYIEYETYCAECFRERNFNLDTFDESPQPNPSPAEEP